MTKLFIDLRRLPPSPFLIWNREAKIHMLKEAGFSFDRPVKKTVSADGKAEYYTQDEKEESRAETIP